MSLPAFLLHMDTAENRTLCRARALSKREAFVARGRGRRPPARAGAGRPKPARICEANTRILRANYQPNMDAMLSNLSRPCAASTEPQTRGESNSVQGAGVKQTLRQRRVGRAFLTAAQAENPSRNPRSERDTLSQRRSKRKVHPGIPPQTGTRFPLHILNSKTYAPSIPKLGRRKPKRNRRRSI